MFKQQALEVLVGQAELVRSGSVPDGGELSLLRQALPMEGFSEVVQWIKSRSDRDLFTSLQRVEAMEDDCARGNRSEVVVQCCLILDLVMDCTHSLEGLHYLPSTFFEHCRTLEDIAHLGFRLNFIEAESCFRRIIDAESLNAVFSCVMVMDDQPTWRGMQLNFGVTRRESHHRVLLMFADLLRDESFSMPAPAATLFLSFVTDAIRGWE